MPSSTWIVIVNYCTPDYVIDCLSSLAPQIQDLRGGRVIVVDNASTDSSLEQLRGVVEKERWSEWVQLFPQLRNGGFASGNNAGIREALSDKNPPEYIYLLNPDTVVRSGAVRELISSLDANPDVGIAGSRLENSAGGVDPSAHRYPTPLGELNSAARLGVLSRLLHRYEITPPIRDEAHECDWVSGASMLIRKEVIEQIGMMDDNYFLYFEEVDYCYRANKYGWKILYVPRSRVQHLEGAATGIRDSARRRPAYWYDSRRRFFLKQYGVGGLCLADLFWMAGRLTFLLRVGLGLTRRHNSADPYYYSFDLLWGDLRAVLSGQAWEIVKHHRCEHQC